MLVDGAFGEPDWIYRRLPHPIVLIGRAISWLEKRLLDLRKTPGHQFVSGMALTLLLVGAAAGLGCWIQNALARVPGGWIALGLLMSVFIAHRSLIEHVRAVADGLDGDLETGRKAVARIVGRDPETLDRAGVSRAAVESLAENFADGVVAPVFWVALLGLPGLIAYKSVNTLDSMIGYRSARHLYFGRCSARLDDVANLIPARLSALVIAIAAVGPRKALDAIRTAFDQASHHRSPNAGWPEAAMAGALRIKLAGPRRYAEGIVDDPFIGAGSPDLDAGDIRRALNLAWRSWIVLLIALVALALA